MEWNFQHTVKDKNLCTIACFWSKTTLIASSVSGAGVNPPFSKMSTFFLRSLALSVPIRRNFQSNEVKWKSLKPWTNFFYIIPYYIKRFCSRLKTSPFDSIWLEISTNWHTTSQGPTKKCIHFTRGRIDPCPTHTARN